MAVLKRQNSAVHRTHVKQRGSCGKPEVATISLARGVFGVDWCTKTETEREQSNAGEFPKTLTPIASNDITHTLQLEHITISISRSTLSLWDFLCFKFKPNIVHISFFPFCTTSFVSWAPFLEANIYVTKYHQILFLQFYIKIWQLILILSLHLWSSKLLNH
jgi:hypothetical protein